MNKWTGFFVLLRALSVDLEPKRNLIKCFACKMDVLSYFHSHVRNFERGKGKCWIRLFGAFSDKSFVGGSRQQSQKETGHQNQTNNFRTRMRQSSAAQDEFWESRSRRKPSRGEPEMKDIEMGRVILNAPSFFFSMEMKQRKIGRLGIELVSLAPTTSYRSKALLHEVQSRCHCDI